VPGAGSDALPLPRAADFPPRPDTQEQRVRETVLAKLATDPDGCLARYQERFGNRLNADNAATLFEEYNHDPARYRVAVHPAAVWIRDELFRRALTLTAARGLNHIAFTAGANAAGKTTAISFTATAAKSLAVLDSTFSNPAHARRLIQQALDARKPITILYVFRPLLEALDGMLERSETEGRLVTVGQLINSAQGSAATLRGLWEQHHGDPRFEFLFVRNTGGSSSLDTVALTAPEDYTEIRKALNAELDARYQAGRIGEAAYRRVRDPG